LVRKEIFCETRAKGRKILQRRIFRMEDRLFYLLCTSYVGFKDYCTGDDLEECSGARAVTSNPSAAGRSLKLQSYKSHRHGCNSRHSPSRAEPQAQGAVTFFKID
jgi:hypothetical protein